MNKIYSSLIAIGICTGLMLILVLTSSSTQSQTTTSATFSNVYNPQIPNKVTVCGQVIPLNNQGYYERFDRELTSIIYTHGNTLLIIKRANRYFPQIAPILQANNIPEDLLYLACIESTLNTRAVSPAKAAGIWQFMPGTAKEYGLEVNNEVDERFNIDKSTAAACKYFKKALAKFGNDWLSVMASYNTGMARVDRQLEAQLADSAIELYLSDETMRYPFRIAAMKTLLENPAQYGFILTADQLYQPREVKIVEVNTPIESWAEWAAEQGTSYLDLRDENPWIRDSKLTNAKGKTYKVRIPLSNQLNRTSDNLSIYNSNWVAK